MEIKGLIRQTDNVCVNVIVIGDDYVVPAGHELQTNIGAEIEKIWNGTGYDPIPQSYYDNRDESFALAFKKIGSTNRAILQAFYEMSNRVANLENIASVGSNDWKTANAGVPWYTAMQVYNWFKAKIRG